MTSAQESQIDHVLDPGFWNEHRKQILGVIAVVGVALAIFLFLRQQGEAKEKAGWSSLSDPDDAMMTKTHVDLDGPVKGTSAEPWAILLNVREAMGEQNFAEAETLLQRLKMDFPDHPLCRDGSVDRMLADATAEKEWLADHAVVDSNPADLVDKEITLQTDLGPIRVGLYTSAAPEACAEFLALLDDESLVGYAFREGTEERELFLAFAEEDEDEGDEDGDEGDEDRDEGDEDRDEDEAEEEEIPKIARGVVADRNNLSHFEGSISFRRLSEFQVEADSKPQIGFYLSELGWLDGQQVVFGTVLDGLDLLKQIAAREKDGRTLNEPVMLTGVDE